MSIQYIRKVTKSRWNNQISDNDNVRDIIPADTIVHCLKTSDNALSIWKVEDIEDAILALASVSNSISSIDIVIFKDAFFDENNISIINKIADSNPVIDLQDKHYDISNLNYETLGDIAKHIANQVKSNENNIIRYTIADIKRIIKKAIENKRLKKSDLSESIQNKI